jgi:hypothetical protein
VRDLFHQTLASRRSSVSAREVRLRTCFIQENQVLRIDPHFLGLPRQASGGHIRTILLRRFQDFF